MKQHHKIFTILVGEDDPDDQMLIKEALEAADMPSDLRFVANGQDLLDYLSTTENAIPDLIVLDLNMPKLDGREALQKIRDCIGQKEIAIAVLTTSDSPEDKALCRRNGADMFFTKPNSFEKLVETMKTISFFIRAA